MTLKEFIDNYIQPNSLVRVLYKNKGNYRIVLKDWDEVSMEWEVSRGQGKYAPYINHKVIGIKDILIRGTYSEAINIVIEEIPLDELREMKLKSIVE